MSWKTVGRFVCLVLLMGALPVPVTSLDDPSHQKASCVIEVVPGLGPACLRDDGLYEVFAPDGRSLGTTHGTDPIPADDGPSLSGARDPECAEDPSVGYYARVIYAYASDRSPTKSDNTVRDLVRTANGVVYDEAQTLGAERDIRVLCDGSGRIDVLRMKLFTPLSQTTFSTVVNDLAVRWAGAGADTDDERVFYWVYFEDTISCGCGGTGHIHNDASRSVVNWNNGEALHYAVTFGYLSANTMLHELSHNNGAVQLSSPESSGGWHCNDGLDVMCYSDGGYKSNYRTSACSSRQYDCNNNDYFHTSPPSGAYLDRFWNLGHIYNRFFEGCAGETGHLDLGTGPVGLSIGFETTRFVDVAGCAGKPFFLEGWLPKATVAGVARRATADMDICWFQGTTELSCDLRPATRIEGEVPAGADRARIQSKGSLDVDYSFRVG